MMRLLYVCTDPGVPIQGSKGASVHARGLITALHAAGHELTVASPRLEPGPNPLPAGVTVVELPAVKPLEYTTGEELGSAMAAQADVIARLAESRQVDGVYERFSLYGIGGARASRGRGVGLVLEVNAPLREEQGRFRRFVHAALAERAEQEALSAADRVFVVSSALGAWVTAQGVEPSRVEVLPNAVPDQVFGDHPRGEGDELTVGFCGGLKPWHGIATLLQGTRRALLAGARVRLEVVGSGPGDELMAGSDLPPGALVRHGALSHAAALDTMSRWDVGAAPFSDVPGFWFSPLKLYEYMAAGLCPLVSDVGELAATVGHGAAGVVIAPDDPAALADALIALDRDRGRVRRLGAAARAAAGRLPGWSHHAARALATLAPRAQAIEVIR